MLYPYICLMLSSKGNNYRYIPNFTVNKKRYKKVNACMQTQRCFQSDSNISLEFHACIDYSNIRITKALLNCNCKKKCAIFKSVSHVHILLASISFVLLCSSNWFSVSILFPRGSTTAYHNMCTDNGKVLLKRTKIPN